MSRRMWVLASITWVAVVIAGSALTWLAIDRAGHQVTGGPELSATQPAVVGTIGSAPSASPTRSTTPPATSTASPTTPAPSSSTSAPSGRPSTSAPKTSSPPARTVTRTWSGTAGFVTVACTGRLAQRKGVSPSDGWSYELGDASGDAIEVKFEHGDESEVRVRATCADGVPQFSVESGVSSGGDG